MARKFYFGVSKTQGLRSLSLVPPAAAARPLTTNTATVKTTTGGIVNDIHLVFTGTGGQSTNKVVVQPAGGVIDNTSDFDASFDPLANNGTFIGTFDSLAGIAYDSGNWTKDKVNVGTIGANDIKLEVVPEPTSMVALGVGALALLTRRRRA